MTSISQYIQTIAADVLPSYSYVYGRQNDVNIEGDNQPSPMVACIYPDQQFLNLSGLTGNTYDGYNLFIRFVEKLDNIAEQSPYYDAAVNRQKLAAANFIYRLSTDDIFQDLRTPIPIVAVIEAYDGNWFGVEINLINLQTIYPLDTICP